MMCYKGNMEYNFHKSMEWACKEKKYKENVEFGTAVLL